MDRIVAPEARISSAFRGVASRPVARRPIAVACRLTSAASKSGPKNRRAAVLSLRGSGRVANVAFAASRGDDDYFDEEDVDDSAGFALEPEDERVEEMMVDPSMSTPVMAPVEREEEDQRKVLGGPVCDAFSALVLEMRAGGHGSVDEASVAQVSSWSNPEPWSSFDGMDGYQVKSCLGDVRRTLKKYAKLSAVPGALSDRLMGAVGAAWLTTAGNDKDAAFVWGGAEKHAQLLNDVCVHKVLFRDEPVEAGNRLAADTLMVLQDLATSRVQLSEDVETVALAACAAFSAQLNHLNALDEACQKLHAASPPPTADAVAAAKQGIYRLGGRKGYDRLAEATGNRDQRRNDRRESRFDRGDRFGDRQGPPAREGDWECEDCGFTNFAYRTSCKRCGAGGGGGEGGGGFTDRGYDRGYDRGGYGDRGSARSFEPRPGDWTCPQCSFSNFASRSYCKQCGEPAPGGRGGGRGGWDQGGGRDGGFYGARESRGGSGVRSWNSERGERGGGGDRERRGGRGRGGGGRGRDSYGGFGGRERSTPGRGGRYDYDSPQSDAGGWDDRVGSDFGGY